MNLRAARRDLRKMVDDWDRVELSDNRFGDEHEAGCELRDAAHALLAVTAAHLDAGELLAEIRLAADDMLRQRDGDRKAAARRLRNAYLDLDDLLCFGGRPPAEWQAAFVAATTVTTTPGHDPEAGAVRSA
jgi:hypothetical protein